MALWTSTDNANGAPVYAPGQLGQAITTTNSRALYGNTTAGTFGVNPDEQKATEGIAHPGWILRTVGSGGRAGRVFNETLVAFSSMQSDGADDATIRDVLITITSQPASATVVGANAASFTVVATTSPSTAMTYQWQLSTGGAYANVTNAGVYSNVTTATLSISNSTGLTGNRYRVQVSASTANTKTSSAAVLTVN